MLLRLKYISALLVGLVTISVLALQHFAIKTEKDFMLKAYVVDISDTLKAHQKEKVPTLSPTENMYQLYDGVETFVMFIGYPRSSHSLVGAILDAHPEIIIPHEYNLVGKWKSLSKVAAPNKYSLFHELHSLSMSQAQFGIRASKNDTRLTGEYTYTYHVPGLWQGRYQQRIKVIGDKKGGKTSEIFANNDSMETLEEIAEVVKLPMKFIHVTRNPFDNIATMTLRLASQRNNVREEGIKLNNTRRLNLSINSYFKLATANQRVRERYGKAVIDIPGHEIVLRPRETIQKLCEHLGVTCSDDYLDKCSNIMYGAPSVTRDKVIWTEEQKRRVTQKMKEFPFLRDYSFDVYPE